MTTEQEHDDVFEQFEETEDASEKFSEYMSEVKEEKHQLVQKIQQLEAEEQISSTKAEEILNDIGNGNYGDARLTLKEALEKQGLEFDAEEKNLFAQQFSDAFEDIEKHVEAIRDDLAELNTQLDDDDMIAYLYGKHSSWTKTSLQELFDTINRIGRTDIDIDDMARVLAAYNTDLTITETRKMLREIRKEANT